MTRRNSVNWQGDESMSAIRAGQGPGPITTLRPAVPQRTQRNRSAARKCVRVKMSTPVQKSKNPQKRQLKIPQ